MDEFRPEYVQALEAARWNFWWYVAGAVPLLLLIPAAAKRRFGCIAFPLSFASCWIAFFCAVQYYWDVKMELAETDAEISDATADTARLFGPFLVGVPLVLVYVALVGAIVYGLAATVRLFGSRNARSARGTK